jgi:hypothetical protein
MENQSFGDNTSHSVLHMHESQSKAWGSPGRKLTKVRKKKTCKGLILKAEMDDSSSFRCA